MHAAMKTRVEHSSPHLQVFGLFLTGEDEGDCSNERKRIHNEFNTTGRKLENRHQHFL